MQSSGTTCKDPNRYTDINLTVLAAAFPETFEQLKAVLKGGSQGSSGRPRN